MYPGSNSVLMFQHSYMYSTFECNVSLTGPELNVQTDTQWASALKTLALFYLTAVQMWTDGIIVATIWLWDWSPLLKHTALSKNNDEDCKAKRGFSSQPGKTGMKNKLRAAWQNAISTQTVVLIVDIKLSFIRSQACKLQSDEKGDASENRGKLHFVTHRFQCAWGSENWWLCIEHKGSTLDWLSRFSSTTILWETTGQQSDSEPNWTISIWRPATVITEPNAMVVNWCLLLLPGSTCSYAG